MKWLSKSPANLAISFWSHTLTHSRSRITKLTKYGAFQEFMTIFVGSSMLILEYLGPKSSTARLHPALLPKRFSHQAPTSESKPPITQLIYFNNKERDMFLISQ